MAGIHHDFARIAQANGIPLEVDVPQAWLTRRGHLEPIVQERAPADVLTVLATIFTELGGDLVRLERNKGGNPSAPDLIHAELGCIVELDELPHFTSARRRSLALYPPDTQLLFELAEYRALIDRHCAEADAVMARETTKEFPLSGGRVAQRAYQDSMRDLLAPTFTGYPVIRIAVPDHSLRGVLATVTEQLAAFTPA